MFKGMAGEGEVKEGNKVDLWIQPLEGGQDYIIYEEQGMHGTGWECVSMSVSYVLKWRIESWSWSVHFVSTVHWAIGTVGLH